MPIVHIPQTGAIIHWPHSDEGRVRITTSIDVGPQGAPRDLPVELSFKRQQLRKRLRLADLAYHLGTLLEKVTFGYPLTEPEEALLVRWGRRLKPRTEQGLPPDRFWEQWRDDIAYTLIAYARRQVDPHNCDSELRSRFTRKKMQTLGGHFSGIDYRLRVGRDHLKSIGAAIADREIASRVLWQAQWYLVPTTLHDWAFRKLPRGTSKETFALWPVIRCAVFVARALIHQQDRALQGLVFDILETDMLTTEASQQYAILCLVDRALCPALKRHNIMLSREQVLDSSELAWQEDLAALFDRFPDRLSWWFKLLLGPEGEAARRFHLA